VDDRLRAFIERHPDAAMITCRPDGTAHMARIELGVVDGRIQSSGAPSLVRNRHVRRDPRCSLFVFGPHPDWVGLETEVTVLDGDDAPERLVALMQARHGDAAPPGSVLGHDETLGRDRLYPVDEYIRSVREEHRLIYEFEVKRAYGNY
jgi:hypothetical protein